MQTEKTVFLDLLGMPATRFVIPAYQRLYSWRERQCRELWLDLHRAARADATHFIGTLLYSHEDPDADGRQRLAVIDGQQRLTTMTLLIEALRRHLADRERTLDGGIDAPALDARYLRVGDGPGAPCKLVLSRNDGPTLQAVLDGTPLPENASENVQRNLAFFQSLMDEDGFDPQTLWRGIEKLFVISAEVGARDNAQLIFESLNSKGKPLTTADLVRNYLLLAQTHEEQTRLYDEYWDPIEGMFQPDPGSLRLDNAIQGWLSVRFRKVRARGRDEVYSVFKQYVEDEFTGTTESLLHELRNFCMIWAENYRYHAVKKYKSAFKWAENGAPTLGSHYEKKQSTHQAFADATRAKMDATDASL